MVESTILPYKMGAQDTLGDIHDEVSYDFGREGYCAMRGSCGSKDGISKSLPCPTDEPASEVCLS